MATPGFEIKSCFSQEDSPCGTTNVPLRMNGKTLRSPSGCSASATATQGTSSPPSPQKGSYRRRAGGNRKGQHSPVISQVLLLLWLQLTGPCCPFVLQVSQACSSTGPRHEFSRTPWENSPLDRFPTLTKWAFSLCLPPRFCFWEGSPQPLLAALCPERHPSGYRQDGPRPTTCHRIPGVVLSCPVHQTVGARAVCPRQPCVPALPHRGSTTCCFWAGSGHHFHGYQASRVLALSCYFFGLFFKCNFSITVCIQYYVALVSGVQHSGYTIVHFTKHSPQYFWVPSGPMHCFSNVIDSI